MIGTTTHPLHPCRPHHLAAWRPAMLGARTAGWTPSPPSMRRTPVAPHTTGIGSRMTRTTGSATRTRVDTVRIPSPGLVLPDFLPRSALIRTSESLCTCATARGSRGTGTHASSRAWRKRFGIAASMSSIYLGGIRSSPGCSRGGQCDLVRDTDDVVHCSKTTADRGSTIPYTAQPDRCPPHVYLNNDGESRRQPDASQRARHDIATQAASDARRARLHVATTARRVAGGPAARGWHIRDGSW